MFTSVLSEQLRSYALISVSAMPIQNAYVIVGFVGYMTVIEESQGWDLHLPICKVNWSRSAVK